MTAEHRRWPSLMTADDRLSSGPHLTAGLPPLTIVHRYSFATCLALFFPCFTGILSGANRASTLADPSTAIPNGAPAARIAPSPDRHLVPIGFAPERPLGCPPTAGTLGAIIFSYFMYTSLMVLFAGVGSRAFLQADHGQVNTLFWPSVAAAQIGIILSSLGQALQCLVVAPRLLASISASGTLHYLKPFAVLTAGEPSRPLDAPLLICKRAQARAARLDCPPLRLPPSLPFQLAGEPKRALLVSYVFGGLLVLLGDLNLVAPLLSMCFLICYACMNLNCFFLDFLKDPHWRPKWK